MAHRKSPARIAKDARIAHFQTLAATAGAAAAPAVAHGAPRLAWTPVAGLEARLVGRIVLPTSPDYNQARQESNPAFQAFPEIIVYCACENDVLDVWPLPGNTTCGWPCAAAATAPRAIP